MSKDLDVIQHLSVQIILNTYKQILNAFPAIYFIIKILKIIDLANRIVVIGKHQFYFKMEIAFNVRINLIVIKFLLVHNIANVFYINRYLQIYYSIMLKINLIKIVFLQELIHINLL